ncbi:hypothetical protein [Edwardsiella tarda]|uniref:hypothetical protein n=1 Tax=Edwardsiella tarda TaxID=636 RepID=UPI00351BFD24
MTFNIITLLSGKKVAGKGREGHPTIWRLCRSIQPEDMSWVRLCRSTNDRLMSGEERGVMEVMGMVAIDESRLVRGRGVAYGGMQCEPGEAHFLINRGEQPWKGVFIKSPHRLNDSHPAEPPAW